MKVFIVLAAISFSFSSFASTCSLNASELVSLKYIDDSIKDAAIEVLESKGYEVILEGKGSKKLEIQSVLVKAGPLSVATPILPISKCYSSKRQYQSQIRDELVTKFVIVNGKAVERGEVVSKGAGKIFKEEVVCFDRMPPTKWIEARNESFIQSVKKLKGCAEI